MDTLEGINSKSREREGLLSTKFFNFSLLLSFLHIHRTIEMSQATTPRYSETSSIWVAALILPLVVLLSGLLIAFLCWRRLRSNNSSLKASNQLSSSPASSQDVSDTSPSSKSNSVLQYPRPLFLSHPSPTLAHRIHRPRPITFQSKSSFPSVSTTVNSQGSRVLVKKGRKSWPPEIGWPIPLEPFYSTNDQYSPISNVEGGIRGARVGEG